MSGSYGADAVIGVAGGKSKTTSSSNFSASRHTPNTANTWNGHTHTGTSHTLMAAALQDHLSRQYSLSLATSAPQRKERLGRKTRSRGKCSECGVSGRAPTKTGRLEAKKKNPGAGGRTNGNNDVEYTLDPAPPPLSLAQRMGLVDAPPGLLNEHSWEKVKWSSNQRHDSSLPCPICQEGFQLSTQVLLSCSHVFHLTCLSSFEKFSGKKCCPLCRTENYQRRVIHEGSHYWKHRAATIIQSNWRGYVARRWYKSYRDKVPPTNPQLRAKHFEKKLSKVTEQILDSCSQRSNQVDILLAQSDSTLSVCREAMKRCEEQLMAGELDWEVVHVKARHHMASDCSVCLCPLQLCQPYSMPRPLSVLSCGHLLHEICIKALEKFSNEGTVHLCPLCRTPYQRTSWGSGSSY